MQRVKIIRGFNFQILISPWICTMFKKIHVESTVKAYMGKYEGAVEISFNLFF